MGGLDQIEEIHKSSHKPHQQQDVNHGRDHLKRCHAIIVLGFLAHLTINHTNATTSTTGKLSMPHNVLPSIMIMVHTHDTRANRQVITPGCTTHNAINNMDINIIFIMVLYSVSFSTPLLTAPAARCPR